MTVYLAVLAGETALGLALYLTGRNKIKDAAFLVISFIVLATVSAMRYGVGYDYSYIYAPFYEKVLADPFLPFSAVRYEPGFVLLAKIISLFSRNYQMLFVVTGVLTTFLFLLYYWIYSPNVYISVFLFLTLSHFYCSIDFIRQSLAGVIALFAFPLLKERSVSSIIKYILIVLFAACFHVSALILIPFMVVGFIPLNKYVLAAYMAGTAVIYFNTERILGFVTKYWYKYYKPGSVHMQEGFNFPFALTAVLIFIVVILSWRKLKEADPRNDLYVGYAFFTLFFSLMGTRHSILDRMGIYFAFMAPVALAIVFEEIRKELDIPAKGIRRKKNIAAFAALLTLIFGGGLGIHQYMLVKDYHGLVPYRTVFEQPFYQEYIRALKGETIP